MGIKIKIHAIFLLLNSVLFEYLQPDTEKREDREIQCWMQGQNQNPDISPKLVYKIDLSLILNNTFLFLALKTTKASSSWGVAVPHIPTPRQVTIVDTLRNAIAKLFHSPIFSF